MNQTGKFFKGFLPILVMVIIAGGLGMVGLEEQTFAQFLSEMPTHSDKEFKTALQSGKPVLVDFGSNRCIPCRQIRPILNEIGKEYNGKAHVLVIDVYKFGELARDHKVHLIPTLIFFNKAGKEFYRHMGVWDKKSIVNKLKSGGMI